MGIALDIDLYKNGFDYQHVDCIQGPIAAASGYYNHSNYFNYCFLHSIRGNMENYFLTDILVYANKTLRELGLRLEKVDCSGYTSDKAVARIAEEVLAGRPVVLVVKYNSLFYSMFYKNSTFRTNHAIIINEYNEANNTFGIKESTLLRYSIDAYENRDVFFSLHITFDMLKDIWEDSNQQFHSQKLSFEDSIYVLHQVEEISHDTNKVLAMSLPIFETYKNDLVNIINSFNGSKDFNADIITNRLRFSGCLKPIFHLLFDQCEKRQLDREMVANIQEAVGSIRDNVLNILNRASLRGDIISKERKSELCSMILDGDKKIVDLIHTLILEEEKKQITNYCCIDIKKHYSNQAFAKSLYEDPLADITGDGTYFIMQQDVVINEEWSKGDYYFHYAYSAGQCDNVSCKGQEIDVPNVDASQLSILGCAEYGNYNEEIEIEYSDGSKARVKADFSDFFQPPVFGESVYWVGAAGSRQTGKSVYHGFNSRLLAKRYEIKPGRVVKLTLPHRKNVHIFALTLEKVE